MNNKKINFKILTVCLVIPLLVGIISGILFFSSMNDFENFKMPPLSPPDFVFPIAWTILYILMGISFYLIFINPSKTRKEAISLYALQLAFNFLWPLLFFSFKLYLFAFVWLLILLILVIMMYFYFYKVDKKAAYLQIPYILWLIFAGYLNFGIYFLNK